MNTEKIKEAHDELRFLKYSIWLALIITMTGGITYLFPVQGLLIPSKSFFVTGILAMVILMSAKTLKIEQIKYLKESDDSK